MRCLITGVNGFAGSYLSEYLLEKKLKVIGTVYPKDSPVMEPHGLTPVAAAAVVAPLRGDIPNALSSPGLHPGRLPPSRGGINNIQTFPCDLSSPNEILDIIKETQPEIIFHLAAQGYVPFSWQDPIGTFNINVLGTLYLLDAIRKYSLKAKILIIGSGDEYGSVSGDRPLTEDTPLKPQNPYAVTKVCTDLLSAQLGKYYNLHIVRVRAFPHIGPRQSPNFVVSDFSRQIALIEKKKQPPIIKTGDLESKRDFTDVRDIVRAYWLAIEKGEPGEVYNISSGKAYSIREILEKLIDLAKTEIKIEPDPSKFRLQDTQIKLGNSQKFRNLTGWEPKIPIEQTLRETLDWWRGQV